MSYYDQQIKPIICEVSEYAPRLQVVGDTHRTNYINVSREKLAKILAILNENDKEGVEDDIEVRRRIA